MILIIKNNIFSSLIKKRKSVALHFISMVLALILSFQSVSIAFAKEDDKTRTIAYLTEVLNRGRTILLNNNDDYVRLQELRKASDEFADYEKVWRIVLGPEYNALTPEQLKIYHENFREYLKSVLALRMIIFNKPTFEIIGLRPAGRYFLVSTIAKDGDHRISIDWLMTHVTENTPKIMDVIIRGASMLASQRAEISQIYRIQGFDGLIASMQALVKKTTTK